MDWAVTAISFILTSTQMIISNKTYTSIRKKLFILQSPHPPTLSSLSQINFKTIVIINHHHHALEINALNLVLLSFSWFFFPPSLLHCHHHHHYYYYLFFLFLLSMYHQNWWEVVGYFTRKSAAKTLLLSNVHSFIYFEKFISHCHYLTFSFLVQF